MKIKKVIIARQPQGFVKMLKNLGVWSQTLAVLDCEKYGDKSEHPHSILRLKICFTDIDNWANLRYGLISVIKVERYVPGCQTARKEDPHGWWPQWCSHLLNVQSLYLCLNIGVLLQCRFIHYLGCPNLLQYRQVKKNPWLARSKISFFWCPFK